MLIFFTLPLVRVSAIGDSSVFINQKTVRRVVGQTGIGVHSGRPVTLSFSPAPEDTGIVFRRIDCNPVVSIPALTQCVGDTRLSTSLQKDGVSISTVEHVVSALAGLGVDNVYVDLDAPEPPVFDGSALPFIMLLREAELEEQERPKYWVRIKEPFVVQEGSKFLSVAPYDGFLYDLKIDFDHPVIERSSQHVEIDLAQVSYVDFVAPARTFGFLREHEYLKQRNLGLGASLENVVVLDDSNVLNPEGLRFPDEFVRHKLLDMIGDLRLLGGNVIGRFNADKTGHALNHAFNLALLAKPFAWEKVPRFTSDSIPLDFL